tara:strand:- start:499 stop:735 length:237 start_codon:yes stop_codon:yes gene_type:complete
MTKEHIENDNVIDFTEYKLHRLVDEFAKANRLDIATVLSDALDKYILGQLEITFVDGWPHIVKETKGTIQSDKSDTPT